MPRSTRIWAGSKGLSALAPFGTYYAGLKRSAKEDWDIEISLVVGSCL